MRRFLLAFVLAAAMAAALFAASAEAAPSLLLEPADLADYRTGGTWSAAFDPAGIENRLPLLFWAGALVLLGAIGFPYVWLACASLPDRGYAFARPVGLLLVGWIVWLAASLELVDFSRATVAVATLLVGLGAAAIVAHWRTELLRSLRSSRRLLLVEEAAFWSLFGAVVTVRWLNPDLWHPNLGGEKPMDLAYLNAVVKSAHFPPFDPWFAGGYINYYYFGFVLVAVLVKLTAIVPYVAYNLAIATLAAFLGTATFGVVAALMGRPLGRARVAMAGVLGLVFVAVIGNLGELRVLRERMDGLIPTHWWYWNPSRVIGHPATEPGPINEFPAFTYLYADLHAHAMALPYTAVVLGLALAYARPPRRSGRRATRVASFALLALALGALWPLNTWDAPTYGLLVLVVLVIAAVRRAERSVGRRLLVAGAHWAAVVGAAYLAYAPFHRDYASTFAGVDLWQGSRTSLGDYLTMHGFFLFAITAALIVELLCARDLGPLGRTVRLLLRNPRRFARRFRALVSPQLAYSAACAAAAGALMIALSLAVAGQGVAALVVGLMTLLAVVAGRRPGTRGAGLWQTTLAFVFVALALSLAVEYVVVAKIDIGRTNTVFKTYLQVWVLLAVGAAVGVARMYSQRARLRGSLALGLRAGLITLFAVALLYPVLATRAKVSDRFDPSVGPTLNGMAFMRTAVFSDKNVAMRLDGDLQAIRWMQDHVRGSPVVAEVNTHPTLYGWGSRYAMFTGNPDIVGWDYHQRQQRPGQTEEILRRIEDVQQAYRTRDPLLAYTLLQRYGVEYVVVGPLERAYFPNGQAKWAGRSGELWEPAYSGESVTIYRLLPPATQ